MMNIDLNIIKQRGVLIVGDVMLDTYHIGEVKRISPEAPVPIVRVKRSYSVLGGAANVARNLLGLESTPIVIGVCGDDDSASIMRSKFEKLGVEYALEQIPYPTTTKTRVVGNDQQIVRVDFEQENTELSESTQDNITRYVERLLPTSDIVVISDYNKGVCTHKVCQSTIKAANRSGKIVIIDPKGSDWSRYQGASIVTPNLSELSDVFGSKIKNEEQEIYTAARDVINRYNIHSLVVTRSEKGISYIDKESAFSIPTQAREVFDVSGAGDTVVATMAAALAASLDKESAIYLANRAAGVVVGKMGTSPILFEELQRETLMHNAQGKILSLDSLLSIIRMQRSYNKRITFTNGCFDILHKGHVSYLQSARKCGDILIIGINSDSSVKRLKGEGRPINDQDARATLLAALECVDYVTLFDEDTPLELIKGIRPDTLVKGGDYNIEDIVGREYASNTITIPFVEGFSTTSTIEKMKE